MSPHRPATRAGSRAGPPVSECVSPVVTNAHMDYGSLEDSIQSPCCTAKVLFKLGRFGTYLKSKHFQS
jgi:hypothetical protein